MECSLASLPRGPGADTNNTFQEVTALARPPSAQVTSWSWVHQRTRVIREARALCTTVHVHTSVGTGAQTSSLKGTLSGKPSRAVFDTEKLDVPV